MALSGIFFLSTEYLEVIFGREEKCFRKQVVFINIGNLNVTQRNYLQEFQHWQRLTDNVSSFWYHCIYLHDSKGSSSILAFFEWMWRIVGNILNFWKNCKSLSCQVMRDESRRGMHFVLKLRPCSHFLVWTLVHLTYPCQQGLRHPSPSQELPWEGKPFSRALRKSPSLLYFLSANALQVQIKARPLLVEY